MCDPTFACVCESTFAYVDEPNTFVFACGVFACLTSCLLCLGDALQSQESQAECFDVKLAEVRSCCEESRLDLERHWNRQAQEPTAPILA